MWLNEYNANIREIVGDELKKQNRMDTFYWMMNQTEHISQYVTESEYAVNGSERRGMNSVFSTVSICVLFWNVRAVLLKSL
jgi:hypothetical protein